MILFNIFGDRIDILLYYFFTRTGENTALSPRIIRLFPQKKPFFLLDCTERQVDSSASMKESRSMLLGGILMIIVETDLGLSGSFKLLQEAGIVL